MKYSKATNYALHTMLFLVAASPDKPVGVQQLAERQHVSPTYLSKILTKLVKAGLIQSVSGANGGYQLKQKKDDISFLDVIHAIEGTASLFDCTLNHSSECLIQQVMVEAENRMEDYLQNKKLSELAAKVTVDL
ncbi:RrF2 family transcriptional regulator [Paenibacillus sp. FSL R7-0345]|uniref:Rrf2 family transcriptional regulator n=1 Tax=Paenibacillus TaxID=44249 RepID=UPI0004F8D697|nr:MULTISPECIES: RrF2 family transcriptional regulator [Paenibacillus]AIQ48449.1 Rrf2 family transcriptional regulator [Paenibacillus sp. FSL R7-0273]KUP21300.1 Rrf2 family transcriptional regulator [Paenibacillus sp. DMB5]OMF88402.1 transcriptional regulator [Paenibacillus sp. FSL R7-0273]